MRRPWTHIALLAYVLLRSMIHETKFQYAMLKSNIERMRHAGPNCIDVRSKSGNVPPGSDSGPTTSLRPERSPRY